MIIRTYMLILVLAAAMPYRFEYSIGPFSTFSMLDLVMVLGMVVLFILMLQRREIYIGSRRVFLCVALSFAFAFVSLPWSEDVSSTVKYMIKIGSALILYLIAVNVGRNFSEKNIRRYWSVFFIFCIFGTLAFFLKIPGFQLLELKDSLDPHLMASAYMRLTNPFIGRAPDYGPILAFGAFVMLAYSVIHESRYYKIFSTFLILCVILTLTRGILLGFIFGLIFFGASLNVSFLGMAKKVIKIVILMTPLLIYIIGSYGIEVDDRTIELSQVLLEDRASTKNLESRFELYENVIDKILESPLLGYGAGVYDLSDSRGESIAAHNSYLQGLLFYGIIIGSIYAFVLLYHFYAFWKISVVSREGRIMRIAMCAAVITMLLSAMSQPFMESSVPRVLLAFLMGLGVLSINAMEREYRVSRVDYDE